LITKNLSNFTVEKNSNRSLKYFFSLASMKAVQASGETYRPPKENIQHFKTWNVLTFCVSFLPSWIHVRDPVLSWPLDPGWGLINNFMG